MKTENIFNGKLRGKAFMKVVKLIAIAVVVLIALAILLTPVFVSSAKCRAMILDKANTSMAGRMDFTSLSMGWLKGFTVREFSFNDDAGTAQVKIKQITTRPHYASILLGDLSFGRTVIEQPRVELNLMEQKHAKVTAKPKGKPGELIALPVSRIDLVINDGDIKVTDKRNSAKAQSTVELSNINSKVNLRPAGSRSEFAVDMMLAQADSAGSPQAGKESEISVKGNVTLPRSGWSLEGTSGQFEIDVNELDLSTLAPLFAMAGVDVRSRGKFSAKIASQIDNGQIQTIDGSVRARDLAITADLLKGDTLTSKVLEVNIKLKGEKQFVKIDELHATSDWLNASAAGVIPVTKKALDEFLKADSVYNLKANFDCDIGAIFAQMPHVLGVREGTKITSGRLSGNVETFTESGRKGLKGQAGLTGLAGVVDAKQVTLPGEIKLDAQVASDKGVVTFDKLNVAAPFASLNCSGTAELVKYSAAANLSQVQEQLGQFISFGKYKMAGQLNSDGNISIKKGKITTAGTAAVKDLHLSSTEGVTAIEPSAKVDFAVTYESEKKTVAVDSLVAAADLGQLNVKDAVLPLGKDAQVPMKLAASATNVNLAKIQPFMMLFANFPRDMQLAGAVASQVSVTSKKDTYRIMTDSTSIKNLKITYPGQSPFEQPEVLLAVDAEVNPVLKTQVIKKLQLTSPQIKVKFNFTNQASEGKLEGQANLDYDWQAISTIAAPYLPKGLTVKGQRSDTIKFSSNYPPGKPDKMLANLNARAKTGFAQADYMGLVFGPTEVEVMAQNGTLMIPPFSSAVNNGQINFAAEADFKRTPAVLKTPAPIHIVRDVQITDQMGKEIMRYINPIFANAVGISGTINFDCNTFALPLVGGTKNDIEIIGTISGDGIHMGSSDLLGQLMTAAGGKSIGGDVKIHPTKFVLQKGFLRYDDMQVDIGSSPFNFKGAIGLDKTLNIQVTLPYGFGGTVKADQGQTGDRFTVPLGGTVDKPKLDVGKLLEIQLKKAAEQELRKSLEGLFKK